MGAIVSFASGKDGVGTTTVAAHVAISLQRLQKSVCLLEADIRNLGDIRVFLNAKQAKTFPEFIKESGRLDPKLAQKWVGLHPSGLYILGAAQLMTDYQSVDDGALSKAFSLLARSFDVVVVDAGSEINPLTFRAFEQSALIYIVTSADIFSVNQAEAFSNRLRMLQFGTDTQKVILNKFDPKGVIQPSIVKQKLKLEVDATLPWDAPTFAQVLASGKSLHTLNPRHPYLTQLEPVVKGTIQSIERGEKSRVGRGGMQPLSQLKQVMAFGFGEGGASASTGDIPKAGMTSDAIMDRNIGIRKRVHDRLLELVDLREMDPTELEKNPKKKEELRGKTVQAVQRLLEEEAREIDNRGEKAELARTIIDEALGLGVVERLLQEPSVTEIMVNGKDQIFVEQSGKITLTDFRFTSDKQLLGCIERIVSPIGRRVDEKTPLCDARLHDGSRINIIIPPLSLKGPMITIRKFFKKKLEVADLVRFGSVTENMADFLRAAVEARLNIVVSGGTGTGKTTLLNLMGSFIPEDERIVTIEDAAELQLPQEHVVTLEARPANLQGEGAITIRELVKNSLRMRPDRIVVGECRGGEALDMLQAMNTGHDGSLTTIHANNARDCIRRMETLVMLAGFDLPIQAIREQIASAVNLIVQLKRYSDGSRKVSSVTELVGLEGETIVSQPIFEFKQTGTDEKGKVIGAYQASGLIPKFVEDLKAQGIALPKGLYAGPSSAGPSPSSSQPSTAPSSSSGISRPQPTTPSSLSSVRPTAPAGSMTRPIPSRPPNPSTPQNPISNPLLPGGKKK